MLRRHRSDVATDLPEKQVSIASVELADQQADPYETIQRIAVYRKRPRCTTAAPRRLTKPLRPLIPVWIVWSAVMAVGHAVAVMVMTAITGSRAGRWQGRDDTARQAAENNNHKCNFFHGFLRGFLSV